MNDKSVKVLSESAFPETSYYDQNPIGQSSGLTKREYFIVRLLAGLNANPKYSDESMYQLVNWAIDQADDLLEKLA